MIRTFLGMMVVLGMMVALGVTAAPAAGAAPCVDLALVLAIDGSGSITDDEFAFQTSGIATALRTGEVRHALETAGTVALSAIFWGDGEFAAQKVRWHVVQGGIGLEAFASEIERAPRTVYGNTDIGSGIWNALDMLADPKFCAARTLINISGDGRETIAPKRRQVASLPSARQRAREMGVTINALTVSEDVPDLAAYFEKSVIVGAGAFVMDVRRGSDFIAAFRRKLVRELSPQAVAALEGHGAGRSGDPAPWSAQK